MNDRTLARLLRDVGADESPSAELLGVLEERAERELPAPEVERVISALHGRLVAGRGLQPAVAGVRREALVRWDRWTTTWEGSDVVTGAPALVRVVRPGPGADAVVRRALARQGRVLRGVVPGLVEHPTEGALTAPLPGPAFLPAAPPELELRRCARALGRCFADLVAREAAGLPLPALGPADLRDGPTGPTIVSLSVGEADQTDNIAWLAQWLPVPPDGELARALGGLAHMPPRSGAGAATELVRAFASLLAGQRHELASRWRVGQALRRRQRLQRAIARLRAAVPPPVGRAAIGVDLEGRVTLLTGVEGHLSWGPADGERVAVYHPDVGLDAPLARRLLRARASAPDNPRLQAESGGSSQFADHACRWINGALRLRTLRLLLDAQPGGR